MRDLVSAFENRFIPFDRKQKLRSFRVCLQQLRQGGFDLFVLEGTGFAAGLAAVIGHLAWKRPYVVSSGDAVSPFLSSKFPAGAPLFFLYERLLYACSAGFVGWTPYLVGRALTMGARRGITAAGWPPQPVSAEALAEMRLATRKRLGIPDDAVVFGLAGSLTWSERYQYCYGAELVRAAALCSQPPYVLIVGDGSGLTHLKKLAGTQLDRTILLPGRVSRQEVMQYLAAMDVGSLPQSVDGVGSFRYTTKLPEYRSANLLVLTNQIPMAYDLDRGDILRLGGASPWDETFLQQLRDQMQSITQAQIAHRTRVLHVTEDFDKQQQIDRISAFLNDLIDTIRAGAGNRA